MSRLFAIRTALALLVVALVAGCSSDGDSSSAESPQPSSAATWADGVCSALGSWKGSITSAAKSVTGGNLSKNSLQAAADSSSSATETLQSDLKGLQSPNTTAGQQAKESVDQLSSELTAGMDAIKSAVEGASGSAGIAGVASTVRRTFTSMRNQISTTYNDLLAAKGEIRGAFQESSACRQLSSSSPSG